ncbi:hypothetical protein JTE90_015077 [Oedothorax gibbosus]|uniref:Uncharacterized protein n=1 Tax=Oedothorax gibbosus TaxID=931172 RepID=A0AAV6VRS9_9ARAC|nr:hypothetical protein JTE90_015077 [Oedothorax gibbosus]
MMPCRPKDGAYDRRRRHPVPVAAETTRKPAAYRQATRESDGVPDATTPTRGIPKALVVNGGSDINKKQVPKQKTGVDLSNPPILFEFVEVPMTKEVLSPGPKTGCPLPLFTENSCGMSSMSTGPHHSRAQRDAALFLE